MFQELLQDAHSGKPLFISDVRARLRGVSATIPLRAILVLPDGETKKGIDVSVPLTVEMSDAAFEFACLYVLAELYNVLSTLGGVSLHLYFNQSDAAMARLVACVVGEFGVDVPAGMRGGYGRIVNVAERMLNALHPVDSHEPRRAFSVQLNDIDEYPGVPEPLAIRAAASSLFRAATRGLEGKALCGVDVGGTDIKVALSVDGALVALKEYDWNPGSYENVEEIIDPIVVMVRLMRLAATHVDGIDALVDEVLPKDVGFAKIREALARGERLAGADLRLLDGVGICFPDVVVRDKIVGGEVPKTLGMRANATRDFEEQFAQLTRLDESLRELCRAGGVVRNTNDGPMAAFTAAVELAASPAAHDIANGVFAHTLGTDLGTGLVLADGSVPEIPLEVYNLIIDLGNYPACEYPPEDVRSLRNRNTGLAGTLQKLTSQAGAFRLAYELLLESRSDLVADFERRGFLKRREEDGKPLVFVPEEPEDMRKPFLAYLMELSEDEDEVAQVFRDLGEQLAVTCDESERILGTGLTTRFLFGRFVKSPHCFELIAEGAKNRSPDLHFVAADAEMAFTKLMRELEATDGFTVAQFGQAVGAIYFANAGLVTS